MAPGYVALLRGINVGKAKRVAMADLRALVEGLGGQDVRTLLNSGNVVSGAPRAKAEVLARRIAAALTGELGVTARVTVLGAADFARVVDANPLLEVADNPSRLMVGFLAGAAEHKLVAPLASEERRPGPPAAPPAPAPVDQDPVAPAAGTLETLHAIPVHQRLDHRVVHEILAVRSGQRRRDGEEPGVLAPVEVVEPHECELDIRGGPGRML